MTTAHISGFQLLEVLYESNHSWVYRAHREGDRQPVILKMLGSIYPSPEKIAWFRREYETTRSLGDLEGVIHVHGLFNEQHRWFMVLEDFGGTSLARLMRQRHFTLDESLALTSTLVGILAGLHQRHVIHKDITPSNIVFNPAAGQLKLIDFGISSVLSRESTAPRDPNLLEGTLAYMSPEQTGRMNRAIDYRTDFYSLGVTLYELVTGQLPFTSSDPLELVHAHIARQPPAPHEVRDGVERALSDIILRLLAKNAEDRYQSAYGLLRDLEAYQRRRSGGHTESFSLGREDVPERFQVPQKLYGREQEKQHLLEAFERVAAGASEVALISGYSGVGKSALVKEIYKPITRQRGYFLSGKFDQLRRDEPYAPLIQAFRGLIRQLLSESAERIASWREKLTQALGPNARVIIHVIPEVEVIIGPQPPLVELEPGEAQNRFHWVFQRFIRVFAQREHPLVLFVDDLQWVDGASLEALQALLLGARSQYLFLIGAYRSNEVGEAHPLRLGLRRLLEADIPIREIALSPLSTEHVHHFVSDAFARTCQPIQPLSELVYAKTGGNPFFLGEFLKHLWTEGLISFDFQRGGWQWSLEQLSGRAVTDNVVAFMAGKVQKLAPVSQRALQIAACMGNRFDLRTLASLLEKAPREVAAALWDALVEGLILPLDDTYKLASIDVQGLLDVVDVEYRFAHDRVQQAAYSLITDGQRHLIHWRLGRLLLANTPAGELGRRLFDIVHQFEHGLEYARERDERDELARLYLLAGRKAKDSAAYEPALRYLRTGLWLLTGPEVARGASIPSEEDVRESWSRQNRLCLELFNEAAEAACAVGQYEEMHQLIRCVFVHAGSLLDKVRSYKAEIQSYTARERLLDGVRSGCGALALLGIEIPEVPDAPALTRVEAAAAAAWAGRDIGGLLSLPEMTEPEKLAAMDLMARLYIPAFNAAPGVHMLVFFHQVILSISHGVSVNSPRAFGAYGTLLCMRGDIESGYGFGMLALRLADRFHGRDKSCAIFLFNCFVRHWRDSYRDAIEPSMEGYRLGLESGDLEYAALNLTAVVAMSFWSGMELSDVAAQAASYSPTIRHLWQQIPQELNGILWQTSLNLLGKSQDPCVLVGEVYDERQKLPFYETIHNTHALASLHVSKLFLAYLLGDAERAVAHGREAKKNNAGIVSTVLHSGLHFYVALACLARHKETGEASLIEQADASLRQLRHRAKSCPSNFSHKVSLVEAERARVLGPASEAREAYDRAIALAQEHRFLQEEALACELAARFHREQGHRHLARYYLRDAHHAYQQWGAAAKVRQLEALFPRELAPAPHSNLERPTGRESTTQRLNATSSLDLRSVLKASQALAGELVLEKLLTRLLTTVIENAGARKASLILDKEGELLVEAEGGVDGTQTRVLRSIPVAASDNLLLAAVYLVARSGQPEVINDACVEGMFTNEPYVQHHRPRSILCMPLVNQGKRVAILYLENNLMSGAFTHERVELLNLLSGEMAIAIEHARLYCRLEAANRELEEHSHTLADKVAERTRELAEKNQQLQQTLEQLQQTQQMLLLREKMASLGTLTAGIAHELRNPLNFISNFAMLSKRQAEELTEELAAWFSAPDARRLGYIQELLGDLSGNTSLIEDHGKRANSIISSMLMHTQSSSEKRVATDLNHLLSQSIKLSFHSIRAREPSSAPQFLEDYDAGVGAIQVLPHELSRVFINMLENACYSTRKKSELVGSGYEPRIWVSTARLERKVEVRIRDNGLGISKEHLGKIFQPFFTTKPPGDGTGLGLSISYDIVVRKHRGDIRVTSQEGECTEFTLAIPNDLPMG